MNDFEAPNLRDTEPPRIFNIVRAAAVSYNMDFVEYLIKTEIERRIEHGLVSLCSNDVINFKKQLVSLVIIQANPEAAIKLKPEITQAPNTTKQQLNG